jgi:hypothetical protein
MKTTKILAFLATLIFLPFANTNAQTQKVVYVQTFVTCWDVDCVGETLCGEVEFIRTEWNDNGHLKKYQLKYSGTLVGQGSHDIYKAKEVENTHGFEGEEGIAFNHNYVWTAVIQKKGGPAIVIHSMYHFTHNANGEITVEFETFNTSCD